MQTVRELRLARGIHTPEELAVKLRLSASTILRAEMGKRISPHTALRIADFFGMKPEEIGKLNFSAKNAVNDVHSSTSG